jgi:hypothetical protein
LRRLSPRTGWIIGLAAALVGCGTSTPTPAGTPSGQPSSLSPVSATPAGSFASPPPSQGLAVSVSPTGVAADPTLLDLVPAADAGATLTYDPSTTASVAADPSLAHDISYLAIGLARPTGAAADDPNLAIVNAARVRNASSAGDAWFRGWRETYDQAACAQANGVSGHAQFSVGALMVFVSTCRNGALTYHVRVGDGAIVLSITSVGPADLGRRIVEKLHG